MKFKFLYPTILHILTLSAFFLSAGCDEIEPPYGNSGNDPLPNDSVVRKVLIEDFTGHKCQACPLAHREASRLHGLFGDRLIVIALHADFWALPSPSGAPSYTYDFRNPVATQVATDFGVLGQPFPKGMVNRMINPGTGSTWVMDWGSWEDRVSEWLALPADAGITMTTTYDSASRMITAGVTIKALSALNQDCELAVYFIEDEIINWQKDQTASPTDVSNYEHNHVLRGSLNGTYGENIGTLQAGQELSRSYSGTLTPSDANPDKVKLVAILSNSVTKEIIQAEEVSLK
ncbi:MAG: hypothetical protein RLZZ630_1734 [Bacteroidota bacterium]|jgi:hypothetical protein